MVGWRWAAVATSEWRSWFEFIGYKYLKSLHQCFSFAQKYFSVVGVLWQFRVTSSVKSCTCHTIPPRSSSMVLLHEGFCFSIVYEIKDEQWFVCGSLQWIQRMSSADTRVRWYCPGTYYLTTISGNGGGGGENNARRMLNGVGRYLQIVVSSTYLAGCTRCVLCLHNPGVLLVVVVLTTSIHADSL